MAERLTRADRERIVLDALRLRGGWASVEVVGTMVRHCGLRMAPGGIRDVLDRLADAGRCIRAGAGTTNRYRARVERGSVTVGSPWQATCGGCGWPITWAWHDTAAGQQCRNCQPTLPRPTVYPEGPEWRCMGCDFTCDDDGPDFCPNDGRPLSRVVAYAVVNPGPDVLPVGNPWRPR